MDLLESIKGSKRCNYPTIVDACMTCAEHKLRYAGLYQRFLTDITVAVYRSARKNDLLYSIAVRRES